MINYTIRSAIPDAHDLIYTLKTESVRPYVEKIWGWDENFQQMDFNRDFAVIEHFSVIEIDGRFIGFVQCCFEKSHVDVAEIHLLSECRGRGIGSDILLHIQKDGIVQNRKIRIGCFKDKLRAKALYQKLGFKQTRETDTHYILEYPG